MTIVYILLGVIILSLIRIFGIAKRNAIELQEISPKIHFIFEQLSMKIAKEEAEKDNKKDWKETARELGIKI